MAIGFQKWLKPPNFAIFPLQITAQKITISAYNRASGIKEINYNDALAILKRREQAKEEYGDLGGDGDNGDGGDDGDNDDNKDHYYDNGLSQNSFDPHKLQTQQQQPINTNNNQQQELLKQPRPLIKALRDQVPIISNQKDNDEIDSDQNDSPPPVSKIDNKRKNPFGNEDNNKNIKKIKTK